MTQDERIKQEIAHVLDAMRTANENQRDYSIGALTVLLWLESKGEMLRATAFQHACIAWDKMREGMTP